MTDQIEKPERPIGRAALLEKIGELSIEQSFDRISTIDAEDQADSLAFDRAARTALSFLRLAAEAAALAAHASTTKDAAHDDNSGALPTESQVDDVLRRYADARARAADQRPERNGAGADSGVLA